ncbi:ABC transporter permease [Spiroplasma monobiae]|uniref:ABC transporter permease n=1 Tax=Spiroplasma monobiae MQ-1 TaxID=1336748 RepID=A0A2K9LUW5_SPISQ|nr:ABC transporter permease [Spiroplasma monobiae]AUM62839.1 ABC transporter permease [Spiroplasma monobiae MQ-1]
MNKTSWSTFKLIFSMQWSNYKKDSYVIFSGWIITTLTLVIWLAFKNEGTGNAEIVPDDFILASAIGISVIRNCLFNLVKTTFDFKKTLFFEKLFSTSISKTFVFGTIILFNQIVNIIVAIFMFSIGMLFSQQRAYLSNVNWPVFIIGFILLAISSNLIAFIIVFTTKKFEWASVIANLFYFLPMFLLGLGIPWTLLEGNKFIMIIGFAIPQRYFLNIMASGWSGRVTMPENDFWYKGHFWIPYLMSILIIVVLIIILVYIFIKKFEFENKKFQKYPSSMKHMAIISSIKKANSIEELNEVMDIKKLTTEIKRKKKILKGKKK